MNMNKKSIEQLYSTSDLVLATVVSLFYPIESIDKTDQHRVQFCFKRIPEIQPLIDQFWRKELRVEPQEFANQMKILKTRIHSQE